MTYNAIDLFSGCGGLTVGLKKAGFNVLAGVELNHIAASTYALNHGSEHILQADIRTINSKELDPFIKGKTLHLLAGCPPCQGFSSIRRLNRKIEVPDERNDLVNEYFRLIDELRPSVIMMENVPQLEQYDLFRNIVNTLSFIGYDISMKVFNVADFGIPQRRKRLVMLGSRIGKIHMPEPPKKYSTVRDAIYSLPPPEYSKDPVHKRHAHHGERIQKMISLIPKNGGSRSSLPEEFRLKCHSKKGIGFNDVYGRLRWDSVASTITGGCLNPSKGRFLHPEQDRAISAREAALLQTFPETYSFPENIPLQSLALLIGNALPPLFSYYQAKHLYKHLEEHLK